jgi:hypothetical protein
MVRQTVIPKTYSLKTCIYVAGVMLALNAIEPHRVSKNAFASRTESLVVSTPKNVATTLSPSEQIELEQSKYLTILQNRNIASNYSIVEDVVSKAVQYLGSDGLGGEQFLKEIAMAESRLGTHPNTIRTSGAAGRGIWQIDRIGFEETKNVASHPILKQYHKNLKKVGIDWEKVTWNDCNKPLYGAIAARLLLVCKPFQIAQNRAKRAKQWKEHYNSFSGKGTPEHYWETIKECYAELDIADRYPNIDYTKYLRRL